MRRFTNRFVVSPKQFKYIAFFALLSLLFIIVTGAIVRLTGSGLGCSDWPTCEENRLIAPLEFHPMVEFINRLITGLVSVAVIAAVLGSLKRNPKRKDLIFWSYGLVAGVLGQIILGGITVKFHLAPPLVMGHFLLSILLVTNAAILLHRANQESGSKRVFIAPPACKKYLHSLVVLASIVLITGTIVTGSGPHGGDENVERLPLLIGTTTRIHSVFVWIFLFITLVTLFQIRKHRAEIGNPQSAFKHIQLLVVAIIIQGGIGYTQYFMGVPVLLVAFHIAGSLFVWTATLRLWLFFSVPKHP